MSAADRLKSLTHLRSKIVQEMFVQQWKDVWFFPRLNGVKGWQGTGDVFFVGAAPNFGRFPTEADKFLYDQLLANGFGDAHMADILKTRARNEDVDDLLRDANLMRRYQEYFQRELEILRPRLVVAFGSKTESVLKNWQAHGIPVPQVTRIWHYVYPFRFNAQKRESKKAEFSGQMERVPATAAGS